MFFSTEAPDPVVEFYVDVVGADVWLEQTDCTILRHGNLLFGFCERDETDDCGVLTFVYDTPAEVDELHERVGDAATEDPHENEAYRIYQFFAEDPDVRMAEFQAFLHDVDL